MLIANARRHVLSLTALALCACGSGDKNATAPAATADGGGGSAASGAAGGAGTSAGSGGTAGVAGIGGQGGSGGTGGDASDTLDTVVTALLSQYVLLAPRSNPDQRPTMIAFATSLPGIDQAGWTDQAHGDNFFAILTDGTPFAMLDNLAPSPDTANSSSQSLSPANPGPLPHVLGSDIPPLSPSAHVLLSLGNAFKDSRSILQSMLQDAGYTVTPGTGTLKELTESIVDDGYFHWHTHSGWVELTPGVKEPVITTATEYDKVVHKEAFIQNLWKKRWITVAGASWDRIPNPVDKNNDGKIDLEESLTVKAVYSLRPPFIDQFFHFSDNSVVMQDSCTSADGVFAGPFAKANAGVYVGWNSITTDNTRMALFTDRLLGANAVPPIEKPPQRPFGQQKVIEWMRAKALDSDGGTTNSKIMIAVKPGSDGGILAPSIESLWVDEGFFQPDPSKLIVTGIFGPRDDGKYKREVLLNGKALNVTDGDDTTIVADIDDTDDTKSAGIVVVTVGGRISNEVPLSLYDIPVSWEFVGADSLKITQTLHYKVRMDVHRYRTEPGGTPGGYFQVFRSRKDSSGTFFAGGTATVGDCKFDWAGSGAVKVPSSAAGLFGLFASGGFDPATGKFPLFLIVSDGGPATETVKCGDGTPSQQPLDTAIHSDKDPVVFMDPPTYAIMPGTTKYANEKGNGTLKWSLAAPLYGPTSKTKE